MPVQSKLLRGSCQCGRYQYVIDIPSESSDEAQIIFDCEASQRISSASLLSAFIRIPLGWYRSQIFGFFPDETAFAIRRSYSHPGENHTQRQFCGHCGTPISYWTEQPQTEAPYIQLTLGSLLTEDLHGLQEMGLLPDDDDSDTMDVVSSTTTQAPLSRTYTTIPWFDALLSGSRLGNMRTTKGIRESRSGNLRVEYEITEWTAQDDAEIADTEAEAEANSSDSSTGVKRKREVGDVTGAEDTAGNPTGI
ncbi:hypothetical protein F5Y16DRAFT_362926 [Xylariaceae sp. FL0255]|nr:hypothetical protein F5Y16DRAFT_362926 [Xylariaceae sp. FL0255]